MQGTSLIPISSQGFDLSLSSTQSIPQNMIMHGFPPPVPFVFLLPSNIPIAIVHTVTN